MQIKFVSLPKGQVADSWSRSSGYHLFIFCILSLSMWELYICLLVGRCYCYWLPKAILYYCIHFYFACFILWKPTYVNSIPMGEFLSFCFFKTWLYTKPWMNTFLNLSCSTSISTLEGDNVLYTAQTAPVPVQPYDEEQQWEKICCNLFINMVTCWWISCIIVFVCQCWNIKTIYKK